MKVQTEKGENLLECGFSVERSSNMVHPTTKVGQMLVEGPDCNVALSLSDDKSDLIAVIGIPGVPAMRVIVEKVDIKQLKGLMNKDVLKFVVKSFV